MLFKYLIYGLLVPRVISGLLPSQAPLQSQTLSKPDKKDLIYELQKAEIIPTVTDIFVPKLTLSIFWENATAELGNTINPSRLQSKPLVEVIDHISLHNAEETSKSKMQYTLALTDPDAPSRDNPEWSEICHWILTNVTLTSTASQPHFVPNRHEDEAPPFDSAGAVEIMPYKPPGPPPKTGKHRYVFLALAPKNGTSENLHLKKPGDRQHWGYEGERIGVRRWASEMGLEVVGANFVYAQNDEQ